jgi:hypothetical protein
MFMRVKRRLLRPTKTARALAESQGTKPAHALDFLLVGSRRVNGEPRQQHLGYLGTIQESAVDDSDSRMRFWGCVERRLDALGFPVGSHNGERLRATIAACVNPLGAADERPMLLDDASDPAFLAFVDRAQNGLDGLWRMPHEASEQLAREQGDNVRLAHVLRFRHDFPLDLRASLLRQAWKEARHPSRFEASEVVAAFRELGDLAYEGRRPDDPLQVYRAVSPTGLVRGLAWSTNQDSLHIFTRRAFIKQESVLVPRPARVYAATIDPDSVVATCEFENEVVVDPARLSNLRLLRLTGREAEEWAEERRGSPE